MQRDEMGELAVFATVASERSFTRAAAILGTSQSAVSQTIRRLEKGLGLRLFARTTRSVIPTEAGERLLETVGPAFADIRARLASLSSLRDSPAGALRLTAGRHAMQTVLQPALTQLALRHPDIRTEVVVEDGLVDIVRDRFDAGSGLDNRSRAT